MTGIRAIIAVFLAAIPPSPAVQAGEMIDADFSSAVNGYLRLVARARVGSMERPSPPSASLHPPFSYCAPAVPQIALPKINPASRSARPPYADQIESAARRHGIRPSFLLAVVEVESNYAPRALSPKGARGLGQVMPATAIEVGVHPDRLWHPEWNLEASARYLRRLADRYDGDVDKILIGYNAGPTVADGFRRIPGETRLYAAKVKQAYRRHRAINEENGQ